MFKYHGNKALTEAGYLLNSPEPIRTNRIDNMAWMPYVPGTMKWTVIFHDDFEPEYELLPEGVQDELFARIDVLERFGPSLGRPTVDTLTASSFANMKEIRFNCDGVWRFAFAFDPNRAAIILCGGDKEDVDQKKFYKRLIATADARMAAHLTRLKAAPRKA